jgi:methyl-accepting chemotaxis protein
MFNWVNGLLNRLRIWQKLGIVGLAFAIPLVITTYFLLDEKSIKIDFATVELRGGMYLRPLQGLLGDLLDLRTIARRAQGGQDGRLMHELSAVQTEIDGDFAAVQDIDERLRGPLQTHAAALERSGRISSLPATMQQSWRNIRAAPSSSDRETTALIESVRALINHIGDSSKLILDPDLDTYYVMDAMLLREPEVLERLHDIGDLADGISSRGVITPNERIQLTQLITQLGAANDSLRTDMDVAFIEQANYSGHRALVTELTEPTGAAVNRIRALTTAIRDGLILPETPSLDRANHRALVESAIEAHRELWSQLMTHENQMLELRRGRDEARRWSALSAVFLAVVLSVFLTWLVMRSITIPLSKAVAVADQLAKGELPEKVDVGNSNDETGVLLRAINNMLQYLDLRNTIATLQASAQHLTDAVVNLDRQTAGQAESVSRQAAALHETQVTAQEIKQTSQLAAERAQSVLEVAERADKISRAGEAAIEKSLNGLTDIRAQVEAIALKIGELNERTAQVGGITQSVKDLADQSNLLALNAAVEAVRSGEHGKGFGVVAREIRSLADQSIRSTNQVKDILDDISNAIRQAALITETGKQRMEIGIVQTKSSGESLRELSNIVRDNSLGIRQIAAAVSQQNLGISQIFGAVTEQTKMMDDTKESLRSIREASGMVSDVSSRVAEVVKRFSI